MASEKPAGATDAVEAARFAFKGSPSTGRRIAGDRAQRADAGVLGLYLSGSFAKGMPDRWSDVDLYVVVADGMVEEMIDSHHQLIRAVGDVATLFPATTSATRTR